MVLVDFSHGRRSDLRVSRRVDDPFRAEQILNLCAPAGGSFEPRQKLLLERLADLAKRRGQIIATLNPHPSEAETRHTNACVERVDVAIRCLLAKNTDLLSNDRAFKDACRSVARNSENTARFLGLARASYFQGLSVGEAQRRADDHSLATIEESRRSKTAYGIELLHGGIVSLTTLNEVLDAARELGKREGVVNRLQADVSAARIYRAIGGWREHVPLSFVKDSGAVANALDGLSKSEAGLVQQSYQDLTGRELKTDLIAAFGSKGAAPFFLSLHAEDITETALVLKRQLESRLIIFQRQQEAIRQLYQNHSPGQIFKIERELSLRLRLKDNSIQEYVASRMSASIAKEIAAYRNGDMVRGAAIQLNRMLESKSGHRRATEILQNLEQGQIKALQELYRHETGRDLRAHILSEMKASPLRDLCIAILEGDKGKIRGAEIACALTYRREFIAARFLGLSQKERNAIIRDYELTYGNGAQRAGASALSGNFSVDLRRSVWKTDYSILSGLPWLCRALDRLWWPITASYPFVHSAVHAGGLSSAELLRYFMVGLGTDLEGIYAVLSNRSHRDISAIERDYANRYPAGPMMKFLARIPLIKNFILSGNLRKDLKVELSGDSEFDVSQMMLGFRNDPTPKQLCIHIFSSLVLRRQHETSGIFAKWSRIASLRGDSFVMRRYDADFEATDKYYKTHIAPVQNPSISSVIRFLFLARLTEIQANSFRMTKNLLGEFLLNSGAFVGVVFGTAAVLSFSSFSYPNVATASFLGSLTWRVAMGLCVLGRGFGKGEIIFQSARALIDGITIFTVRTGLVTLGQFIGGQLSKSAAKGGFKSGFNSMIKKMENSIRRQDKARYILAKGSVVRSNEDLRSTIQGYTVGLKDVSWPIGKGAFERFPAIEQVIKSQGAESLSQPGTYRRPLS